MSENTKYDVIVFGASGFTGKFVVEEAFKQSKKCNFTLAVSGRSSDKIRQVLKESADYTGEADIANLPVILTDVNNPTSLDTMAKRAKVILNCVGPYRFYGEQVVRACVQNGTHHLDISGEPQYLETMQLKYHKEAEEKGCYVVGACGFDSIPMEMGIKFVTDLFDGSVNDVEGYVLGESDKNRKIHYGTWESAVYGFAHRGELGSLRKKLFPQRLPRQKFPYVKRPLLFYSKDVNKWTLPFPGSDKSVAMRSQSFLHFEKNKKPVQFNPYSTMPSLFSALCAILFGGIFGLFSSFKCGRYLLLNFPGFFSFGKVSREGGTRSSIEKSKMELMFVGRGWSDKSYVDNIKPNRKMLCSITGPEEGYITCSICLVQAAVTIMQDGEKMPKNGGVYAPLAAFHDTDYIKRLQSNGINFNKLTDVVL